MTILTGMSEYFMFALKSFETFDIPKGLNEIYLTDKQCKTRSLKSECPSANQCQDNVS